MIEKLNLLHKSDELHEIDKQMIILSVVFGRVDFVDRGPVAVVCLYNANNVCK